jgi:RNA polymerase sigma-70 factor (ECF subfamily)
VTDQNDLIIIRKVLDGDVNAYTLLVNSYKDLALTLAYNILLNKEDAEETVQDAFVKAFLSLKSFKGNSRFSTWLYRIVVNTSLNRKKIKKITIVTIEEQVEGAIAPDLNIVFRNYAGSEQKKFIKLALNMLSEGERICLIMYYLNELTIDEIFELTGISSSNIKVLLYRGRKHLYSKLQEILKDEINHLM